LSDLRWPGVHKARSATRPSTGARLNRESGPGFFAGRLSGVPLASPVFRLQGTLTGGASATLLGAPLL